MLLFHTHKRAYYMLIAIAVSAAIYIVDYKKGKAKSS